MRIRSVTLIGFGPFKTSQFVDFRAFDGDGLFLITGETGAGKSSILDAIAYALYNKTPRWDHVSGTGASNAVRSDFCGVDDPTEVVVEFETNGEEYRVTRSPEYDRPKARGEGVTKQSSRVLIELLEGKSWVGKATKEREAAELIEGLLRLNKDEFLQVIMLAQGRFQELLLANSEQRLDLLSKLFGTGRFADYQVKLGERRSAANRKVESARTKRAMLLDGIDGPEELGEPQVGHELEWIVDVTQAADAALAAAKLAIDATVKAEKAALDRLDIAKRQARLDTAKRTLADLTSKQESVDSAKTDLARAERAERVRPLLEDAAAKATETQGAESDVARTRPGYKGPAVDEELPAEVARLAEEIGTLSEALQDEQRAEQLELDHATKNTEVETLAAEFLDMTATLERLQGERAKLVPVSAQLKSAQEKVDRSQARLAAATEAAAVAEHLLKEQEEQLAADQSVTAARVRADDLLDRFLHGQAAVLATTLIPNEPCTVCGSLEHPSPATFSDEPVTQDDVDSAQAQVARLEPVANAAKDRVDKLRVKAAELSGAAGEGDTVTLKEESLQAEGELATATSAAGRIEEIDGELLGEQGIIMRRGEVETASKRAETELTTLRAELDSLTKKITRLRGGHPTVKARHESLVAERDGAKRLVDAIAKLDLARKQSAAADAKLAEKLKQENFESPKDLEDALLEEDAVKALKQSIDAHAAAVSENQGILKQSDLQHLPSDLIAVDEASATYQEAQRAVHLATTEKANAETTLKHLETKRDELAALITETEELVSEYELLHRLAETVNGRTPNTKNMSLESYYLAAELEEVLGAANVRLRALSQGRFEFRHTERGVRRANAAAGLEIEVFDEYTGTARPANQLSGGQQFLASLALALGLAEVVTSRAGGIELNTLFVDEGFGGLSDEYLEIAMETLDSLKQGGRTVGVISHVASMKERIATQLRVLAVPGGPSEIVQATE